MEREPLKPLISLPITLKWLQQYAELSGDRNTIHLNPEAGKQAGFSGAVTHGMLSMGMMSCIVSRWLSAELIIREYRTRFHAPLYIGDCLHIHGWVLEHNMIQLEGRNQLGQLIVKGTIVLGEVSEACPSRYK